MAAADGSVPEGHLIVGDELSDGMRRRERLPMAPVVAAELGKSGLAVRLGPVVSAAGRGVDRPRVAGHAVVLDSRSATLLERLRGNPLAVVHAVGDDASATARVELASLASARGPLERWARACGRHEVVLAAPRSFCAGVDRAIATVRRAIDRHGAPVYVRRQIVHNLHVVRQLEQAGAVFVQELDEVPHGATVVLAAHGVSPVVRAEADSRGDLTVIDATCPLVSKVHSEARRYAASGHQLVLIGHADHDEVQGTLGEAPDRFHLVEGSGDVAHLDLDDTRPIAYLTQTTLATDETAEIADALRRRFPSIVAPPADDICYATQNRQDAVRAIAAQCDLLLVVGSANSSNTARLVEVGEREGCRSQLLEDVSELQLGWLDGATTIGLTAGASAPEFLVQEVLDVLQLLGPLSVRETTTTEETVRFALPIKVR